MENVSEDKRRHRSGARTTRNARAETDQLPARESFAVSIGELAGQIGARRVASFVPHGSEPDILGLPGGSILLPRLFLSETEALPAGSWAWWDGRSPMERPVPGRPAQPPNTRPGELSQVDLVLVPALAADLSGTRVGQGGGWYDRALQSLLPGTVLAGVMYHWEVFAAGSLPREDHDVLLDWVITDRGAKRIPQAR